MTGISLKMIVAVMHGMMPWVKTVSVRRFPPDARSTMLMAKTKFLLMRWSIVSRLMPLYFKCFLGDEDGLAASLLDRFLGGLGELVGVDGDRGLDLSVIEDLDEAILLAEEAKGDDLVQGELRDIFCRGDLGDAV